MEKDSTTEADILQFRQDIEEKIKSRVREAIETVLEEELELALGASRHERTGQRADRSSGR